MTRRAKAEVAAMLGVPENELDNYVPRFNIAPTQPYFILKTRYESREAIPATWGLVNSWAKDAGRASMCINAKAETVDKLPSFRGAFEQRRCVVPADGFYEWRGPKARREPLWIHPADDDALLLFAGLFEAWQPPASPLVNSVKNEGPELLEDLSLFGYGVRAGRPG